jgi:hypothetical protein
MGQCKGTDMCRCDGSCKWTDEVKARCAGRCGDMGEPPCYELPRLTSDAAGTAILPCETCLKGEGNASE